ncbi:hypothetical protein ACWF2L_30660 [Streptomyces anulatus]
MSTLILAALIACALALPVVVVLSRTVVSERRGHDTPHGEGDCRHCAALTVPPIPTGLTVPVFIPRQPGGEA